MLIAGVGAPSAAHPALQTSYCEKTGQLSTLGSTVRRSNTADVNWQQTGLLYLLYTVLGFLMKIFERP